MRENHRRTIAANNKRDNILPYSLCFELFRKLQSDRSAIDAEGCVLRYPGGVRSHFGGNVLFKRTRSLVYQYFWGDFVILGAAYALRVELAEIALRYHCRHASPSCSSNNASACASRAVTASAIFRVTGYHPLASTVPLCSTASTRS